MPVMTTPMTSPITSSSHDKNSIVIVLDYRNSLGDMSDFDTLLDIYYGYCKLNRLTARYWHLLVDPQKIDEGLSLLQKKLKKLNASKIILLIVNPWLIVELHRFFQEDKNIILAYSYKEESSKNFTDGELSFRYGNFPRLNEILENYVKQDLPQKLSIDNLDDKAHVQLVLEKKIIHPRKTNLTKGLKFPRSYHRELLGVQATCGYSVSLKNNSALAGVKMPKAVAEKKGCSFCEFSPPSYDKNFDKVFYAKLCFQQIQQTLTLDASVRIYVCHDQLFLLYFDLLVDLLQQANLDDITFYLSSRVSFINHNQTLIETILKKISSSKIKLAFHLIGFENFSQRQLDLMNKGQKVVSMIRCLDILQGFEKDFLENFTASTQTHGFILYTPWLTYEELLENVKYLKKYSFEKYCSNYFIRKMRLTPNLPLYYKAKQDGLLRNKKSFYAKSIAYEDDHSWKFQDQYVDFVYRLCLKMYSLKNVEPSEILLKAVEVVENLRKFPSQCRFDIKIFCEFNQQCFTQSLPYFEEGSSSEKEKNRLSPKIIKKLDDEFFRQTLCEKLSLENSVHQRRVIKLELKKEIFQSKGPNIPLLVSDLFSEKDFQVKPYRSRLAGGNRRQQEIYFISSKISAKTFDRNFENILDSPNATDEAVQIEQAMHQSGQDYFALAHRMGTLLGYPACCTDSYLKQRDEIDTTRQHDSLRIQYILENTKAVCPLLLPWHGLVSHFACQFLCAASIDIAQKNLRLLAAWLEVPAEELFAYFCRSYFYIDEARQVIIENNWLDFETAGTSLWQNKLLQYPDTIAILSGYFSSLFWQKHLGQDRLGQKHRGQSHQTKTSQNKVDAVAEKLKKYLPHAESVVSQEAYEKGYKILLKDNDAQIIILIRQPTGEQCYYKSPWWELLYIGKTLDETQKKLVEEAVGSLKKIEFHKIWHPEQT